MKTQIEYLNYQELESIFVNRKNEELHLESGYHVEITDSNFNMIGFVVVRGESSLNYIRHYTRYHSFDVYVDNVHLVFLEGFSLSIYKLVRVKGKIERVYLSI